ncbi:MAG TPA: EAL domain-containing protein [Burkholderiales bacterium]|nr:EAL domain-containing protein [Burkholderiales bacterium]
MNVTPSVVSDGQTILIVDDTPSNLGILVGHLESLGFQVAVAQNGEEGITRAQFVLPDLILLDVMLPEMDGFEACRRLKSIETTRDIPVIFMTALSETSDKLMGFAAGGVDYVTKPFQIAEVLARVNTQLSLRRTQKQLAEQNNRLQQEIAIRERTETALQHAYDDLEERVARRTNELAQANASLKAEVNERTWAQQALKKSAEEIFDLYNNAPCGYHSVNKNGVIVQINDTELQWLGYSREEVIGKRKFSDFLTPESAKSYEEAFGKLKTQSIVRDAEFQLIRRDNNIMWVLLNASVVGDAAGEFVMSRSTVYDVTERKQQEERIRYMAHHDMLTGLPNRMLLRDRVNQAIAQAHRNQTLVAVIFIDLDYFKNINDSLGHQIGDRLLQKATRRLQRCLREGDSVARLGGDEFVISLPNVVNGNDAAVVAQKALDALEQSFIVDGHELHVSCSIGISLYPADGGDAEALMRAADTAMYYAKEKGRSNYQFFTSALNTAVQQRLALATKLRQALALGELVLYYQPQVDLETGKIFSAEALLRWRRAGGEPISCSDFISVAEETGLILPIGEWALYKACEQLRCWRDAGAPDLRMAVNVSSRQFYQPNFTAMVTAALDSAGLPANALELEITERMLMQPSEDNITALNQLSEMGVQLSVDDFGIGYSSLAYLQRFPIHALKIDQSFVGGIGSDPNDTAIVSAIIAMAQSLRLKIVAEGVENLQQIMFLKARGCLAAQGFYYSVPLSAEAFAELLHKQPEPFVRA